MFSYIFNETLEQIKLFCIQIYMKSTVRKRPPCPFCDNKMHVLYSNCKRELRTVRIVQTVNSGHCAVV